MKNLPVITVTTLALIGEGRLPSPFAQCGDHPHVYLCKIEGDSMQGAGIYCGDLVIVDRSLYAEHGDIVIAALNSEPVCKRLHMRGNEVILQSENPKYPSRHVLEGDDLLIWGVVKYSVRDHDKA